MWNIYQKTIDMDSGNSVTRRRTEAEEIPSTEHRGNRITVRYTSDVMSQCENCDDLVSVIYHCETCETALCDGCDMMRHKNLKAHHSRVPAATSTLVNSGSLLHGFGTFRNMMFGNLDSVSISNDLFLQITSERLTPEVFLRALQTEAPSCCLYELLSHIKDALHNREELEQVLRDERVQKATGALQAEDIVTLSLDCCKQTRIRQSLLESAVHFDYPICIGHRNCLDEDNNAKPYGVHISEVISLFQEQEPRDTSDEGLSQGRLVVSIATAENFGASHLLNEIWGTGFEERCRTLGIYHEGLIQCQLPHSSRLDSVIDIHGPITNIPEAVASILLSKADLIIIHLSPRDLLIQDDVCRPGSSLRILEAHLSSLKISASTIVVIPHGLDSDKTRGGTLQFCGFGFDTKSCKVQVQPMSFPRPSKTDFEAFQKLLQQSTDHQHSSYNLATTFRDMEHYLSEDIKSNIAATVTSSCRQNLWQISGDVIQANLSTSEFWFPLQKLSTAIAKLDDEIFDEPTKRNHIALRIRDLKRQRCEAKRNVSEPVTFFMEQIASYPDSTDALASFQGQLSMRFVPKIWQTRYALKQVKDEIDLVQKEDDELIRRRERLEQTLKSMDVAVINFIRELIEIGSLEGFESNALAMAKQLYITNFKSGKSIEIVNGDSSTINGSFLEDLDWKVVDESDKPFVSITVVGAESSGKSTLWNELWNTDFPVSHGKCSRGFWSSIVRQKDGPNLVINDTEGILSPVNNDRKFNQKLILFAFSVSNILVFNIRGEGDQTLVEIMELIIYAAHKLSLFHRPKLVFVNRDVMGRNGYEQNVLKNVVFEKLKKACTILNIQLEAVVDLQDIITWDLPTAIVEPAKTIAGVPRNIESFTAEFSVSCRKLRSILADLAKKVHMAPIEFPKVFRGTNGWISLCDKMWRLARLNADLYTFKSVNEKMQMEFVETKLQTLLSRHLGTEFRTNTFTAMQIYISQGQSSVSIPGSSKKANSFARYVEIYAEHCCTNLSTDLKLQADKYPGGGIPEGLMQLYFNKLGGMKTKIINEQTSLYNNELKNSCVRKKIADALQTVNGAIEQLNGKHLDRAKIEQIFDSKCKSAKEELAAALAEDTSLTVPSSIIEHYAAQMPSFEHQIPKAFLHDQVDLRKDCNEALLLMKPPRSDNSQNNPSNENRSQDQIFDSMGFSIANVNISTERFELSYKDVLVNKVTGHGHNTFAEKKRNELLSETVSLLESMCDSIWQYLNTSENWASQSLDWHMICRNVASGVDTAFRPQMTTLLIKYRLRKKIGVHHSFMCELHAIACRFVITFYKLQRKHRAKLDLVEFDDYASRQRMHVVIRAQCAESSQAMADEMGDKIIAEIEAHVRGEATTQLELKMADWYVTPSSLSEKAMQLTFVRRDADAAWDYIANSSRWIKENLFDELFDNALAVAISHVFHEYLSSSYGESVLCLKFEEVFVAFDEWLNQSGEIAEVIERLRMLQGLPQFAYLESAIQSCIIYAENSLQGGESSMFDSKVFTDALVANMQTSAFAKEAPEMLEVSSELVKKMNLKSWETSRGCDKTCPYCRQKCSRGPGHVKHECDHHLLQAFTGWRCSVTSNPTLDRCSDPYCFKRSYYDYDWINKYPFEQHMAKFHDDWHIIPDQDDCVSDGEKACWLKLRHRFAAKYGYNTTTPKEWEELYGEDSIVALPNIEILAIEGTN